MLLEKSENLRPRCQDLWYKVKNSPAVRKVQTKSSWKKTVGSVRNHDGRGSIWSRPWRNTFWACGNERRGWEHVVKTWPVEMCAVQGCRGDQGAWHCWSEEHRLPWDMTGGGQCYSLALEHSLPPEFCLFSFWDSLRMKFFSHFF